MFVFFTILFPVPVIQKEHNIYLLNKFIKAGIWVQIIDWETLFLFPSCDHALSHIWHLELGWPTFPVGPGPRGFLGHELSVLNPGQSWANWDEWSPFLADSALNFLKPFHIFYLLITKTRKASGMWEILIRLLDIWSRWSWERLMHMIRFSYSYSEVFHQSRKCCLIAYHTVGTGYILPEIEGTIWLRY